MKINLKWRVLDLHNRKKKRRKRSMRRIIGNIPFQGRKFFFTAHRESVSPHCLHGFSIIPSGLCCRCRL